MARLKRNAYCNTLTLLGKDFIRLLATIILAQFGIKLFNLLNDFNELLT